MEDGKEFSFSLNAAFCKSSTAFADNLSLEMKHILLFFFSSYESTTPLLCITLARKIGKSYSKIVSPWITTLSWQRGVQSQRSYDLCHTGPLCQDGQVIAESSDKMDPVEEEMANHPMCHMSNSSKVKAKKAK